MYSVSTFFRLIQYKREGMQLHFHISRHIAHLGWETPVLFYTFYLVYIWHCRIKLFLRTLTLLPMFEFQSVRRSFPRNLAENSEAASFLDQTTSFETEVQEREPWDFYEWITCNEKPRCAPNIFPIMFWREI